MRRVLRGFVIVWQQIVGWARAGARGAADSIVHPRLRSAIMGRLLGIHGAHVTFGRQLHISHPASVRCGEHVLLNDRLRILGDGGCTIGRYTYLAPDVQVLTTSHDTTDMAETRAVVDIGEMCWIGAGVLLLPGVRIGRGSVIGAGSVVTGEIPDAVVAAGNPARVLRPRALRFPYRLPGGRHALDAEGRVVPLAARGDTGAQLAGPEPTG